MIYCMFTFFTLLNLVAEFGTVIKKYMFFLMLFYPKKYVDTNKKTIRPCKIKYILKKCQFPVKNFTYWQPDKHDIYDSVLHRYLHRQSILVMYPL